MLDAMASEAEMLAVLEAQRAWFASDEHIKERAAIWRDATPQECLEATAELCAEAALFLSRLSDAELDRALQPEPLPPGTIQLLEAIARSPR
jgi:hypothetical protein